MKEYAVSDLVKEVKVILDRNQESAALVPTDSDTLSQGEIVRQVIVDAARVVLTEAPSNMVDGEKYEDMAAEWVEDHGAYVGSMYLPSDLIRLLSVKAEGWRRPATIISEEDDAYKVQTSPWGVRGNAERPVAAIVHVGGDRMLELYTSKTDDVGVDFSYVKMPSIDNKGNIELPSTLKDAIIYMAGYMTCVVLGDTDTAVNLLGTARKLAGIVEPQQNG